MPNDLLRLSDHLARVLLRAYPPTFRAQFGAEMAQVLGSLYEDTYERSGLRGLVTLWLTAAVDLAGAALYQWWLRITRRTTEKVMETHLYDSSGVVEPLSPWRAALGALPFLLFGLACIFNRLDQFVQGSLPGSILQALLLHPLGWFCALVFVGLGAGVALGFPRWAFTYLVWSLMIAAWWSGVRFWSFMLPGGSMWTALALVLLLGLLVSRSLRPLRALWGGLRHDWTLFSLALYIFYAFVLILFDENHHPGVLGFILATALSFSLGAWGYYRASTPLRQVLALLGGLLGAVALYLANIATAAPPQMASNEAGVMMLFFGILTVIMLANALLARWNQRRMARKA